MEPAGADTVGRLSVALVLLALVATSWARHDVRTIEIDIVHSRFSPERIDVRAGERVRFLIRNGDPIDHEFILGDEHVQLIHEEGTEAHHGTVPGEVSIPALAEAVTTYRFDGSGELIIGCHLPGHYDYGMRGEVRIR